MNAPRRCANKTLFWVFSCVSERFLSVFGRDSSVCGDRRPLLALHTLYCVFFALCELQNCIRRSINVKLHLLLSWSYSKAIICCCFFWFESLIVCLSFFDWIPRIIVFPKSTIVCTHTLWTTSKSDHWNHKLYAVLIWISTSAQNSSFVGKGSTQNGPSDFFFGFHPRILIFPKSTNSNTHTLKVWSKSHKSIRSVMPV